MSRDRLLHIVITGLRIVAGVFFVLAAYCAVSVVMCVFEGSFDGMRFAAFASFFCLAIGAISYRGSQELKKRFLR